MVHLKKGNKKMTNFNRINKDLQKPVVPSPNTPSVVKPAGEDDVQKLLSEKEYDTVYEQGLERIYNPVGISVRSFPLVSHSIIFCCV